MKSEFKDGARAQTVFRFSDDLVEKAGWQPGVDQIELLIDRSDLAIRAKKVACGGYKLTGSTTARSYVKFTAAKGMPVSDQPSVATDVVVVGGEIMFVLPAGVQLVSG